MLNMSVAPSIKTPTENSTATADSGLLGISDPVSEEFSNILDARGLQTTNSRGKSIPIAMPNPRSNPTKQRRRRLKLPTPKQPRLCLQTT